MQSKAHSAHERIGLFGRAPLNSDVRAERNVSGDLLRALHLHAAKSTYEIFNLGAKSTRSTILSPPVSALR
jgi:hypothetical protein